MKKLLFSLIITFFFFNSYSQNITKIRGTIKDENTLEPLPFVNISFRGTQIGTISDFEGNFFLQSKDVSDTLDFSTVGYTPEFVVIQKGMFQEFDIIMHQSDVELDEIVVHPGENPAWRIMREICKHRKQNNPDRFLGYSYQTYSKMEFDLNNYREDLAKKPLVKNFDFIFDYADTSAETGKVYLPIMITESLSDVYHQKNPEKLKEVIHASRISGVEQADISQFTGQMYLDVNVYQNFIPAFGHNFVSPVGDLWKANYKYYLLDSLYKDGHYLYHLSFKPKRKQDFTFAGEFFVHDSTFAIQSIKARMSDGVNINFVNDVIIEQKFDYVDSTWFLTHEELFLDIKPYEKTIGLFGRRTMDRKNIAINPDFPNNFFSSATSKESIVEDGATSRDPEFWNENRYEKLSEKELQIYQMVDSIKEVPIFKNIYNTIDMLVTGYWKRGLFEYGPIFKTYSFNQVEGNRFRIGARTSNDFSKDVELEAYIAYGTRDRRLKYGFTTLYMFNTLPRRCMEVKYKNDVEQLGKSINAFAEDNIMSTMMSRSKNDNLLLCKELSYKYEHEYFEGFSNIFGVKYRRLYPSDSFIFKNDDTQLFLKNITSIELNLHTHFAYNEKFVSGAFHRVSMGSKLPSLDFDFSLGFWNNNSKWDNYYRCIAMISQNLPINPIGKLHYILETGKIFGSVPYPLLKLHEGNNTYVFDSYSFNLMNLYEFASDEYLSLTLEHHFNGFFLNHIPLFRKLNWREIFYAKGLVGSISDKNSRDNAILTFPEGLSNVHKPYLECGVGIENIFKFFRLDAVWRLTYLDHPGIKKFSPMFKIQVIL